MTPKQVERGLRLGILQLTDLGVERLCSGCCEWWPLDEEFFQARPGRGFGFVSMCRACTSESRRIRRHRLRAGLKGKWLIKTEPNLVAKIVEDRRRYTIMETARRNGVSPRTVIRHTRATDRIDMRTGLKAA